MFREISIAAFFLALADMGDDSWAGIPRTTPLRNHARECPLGAVGHHLGIWALEGQPSPSRAAYFLGLPESFCHRIANLSDFWGNQVRWTISGDAEIERALARATRVALGTGVRL